MPPVYCRASPQHAAYPTRKHLPPLHAVSVWLSIHLMLITLFNDVLPPVCITSHFCNEIKCK